MADRHLLNYRAMGGRFPREYPGLMSDGFWRDFSAAHSGKRFLHVRRGLEPGRFPLLGGYTKLSPGDPMNSDERGGYAAVLHEA